MRNFPEQANEVRHLYLDEDIKHLAGDLLLARGYDILHARDHLFRATDGVQLLTATRINRIVITNNQRDFVLLHDAWHNWSREWNVSPVHTGILLTRNTWPALYLVERIEEFFSVERPTANRLYRWAAGRGWELQEVRIPL